MNTSEIANRLAELCRKRNFETAQKFIDTVENFKKWTAWHGKSVVFKFFVLFLVFCVVCVWAVNLLKLNID